MAWYSIEDQVVIVLNRYEGGLVLVDAALDAPDRLNIRGAAAQNRTEDLMITNQALYQLSYSSTWLRIIGRPLPQQQRAPQRFLNTGLRFSTKAAIPSFWSSIAKHE